MTLFSGSNSNSTDASAGMAIIGKPMQVVTDSEFDDDDDDDTLSTKTPVILLSASMSSSDEASNQDKLPPRPEVLRHRIKAKREPHVVKDYRGASPGTLLVAIQELQAKLQAAEADAVAERSARLKKDRNLRKLAKELNKRFLQAAEDAKTLNRLEESLESAEGALGLAKVQLEELAESHERAVQQHQRELEQVVEEAKKKHSNTLSEHHERIAQLSQTHANGCQELSRELVQAYKEVDMLRNKSSSRALDFTPTTRVSSAYNTVLTTLKPRQCWNVVWNLFQRTCEDVTSRKRTNGMMRGGIPLGGILRQLFWK